jgi:hypothetical protein
VPRQSTVSVRMSMCAEEPDIVNPVASATYATRQIGHFGMSASSAPGKTQLATPLTRLSHELCRGASGPERGFR